MDKLQRAAKCRMIPVITELHPNHLKWVELQLGRISQVLAWYRRDKGITAFLRDGAHAPNWLGYDEFDFDAILGILFLRANLEQLQSLERLPEVLDNLKLPYAATALLYALGHDEAVSVCLSQVTELAHKDFFIRWRDQPAGKDLPRMPKLSEGDSASLESCVLGCTVVVNCANESPYLDLAESILAALESVLATGIVDRIVSREPRLTVEIESDSEIAFPFTFELSERMGRPHIQIKCSPFDANDLSPKRQVSLRDSIGQLLSQILARVIVFSGTLELGLKKLLLEDRALERSLNFTGSFVVLRNMLGPENCTRLDSLIPDEAPVYELRRSQVWDDFDERLETPGVHLSEGAESEVTRACSDIPKEAPDFDRIKHTDIDTISLIREPLWERADWYGTAFMWPANEEFPPALAILYRDGDAGRQIVTEWIAELGKEDIDERLRVSIIRGIDRSNSHAYRVSIGLNPDVLRSSGATGYVAFLCRLNKMEPSSSANLDGFLRMYSLKHAYLLTYATLSAGSTSQLSMGDVALLKRDIHVRHAWEIASDDIDSVAIRADDEPFIPDERAEDAPVLELLRQKRQR